jgi:hypothetical protein
MGPETRGQRHCLALCMVRAAARRPTIAPRWIIACRLPASFRFASTLQLSSSSRPLGSPPSARLSLPSAKRLLKKTELRKCLGKTQKLPRSGATDKPQLAPTPRAAPATSGRPRQPLRAEPVNLPGTRRRHAGRRSSAVSECRAALGRGTPKKKGRLGPSLALCMREGMAEPIHLQLLILQVLDSWANIAGRRLA